MNTREESRAPAIETAAGPSTVVPPPGFLSRIRRLVGPPHAPTAALADAGPPVLIYQMGKVASTTILEMVSAASPGREVTHVHGLTAEFWEQQTACSRAADAPQRYVEKMARMSLAAEKVQSRIEWQQAHQQEKWKIVTLCREPIGWGVSMLFQFIELLDPSLVPRRGSATEHAGRLRARYLTQVAQFLDRRAADGDCFAAFVQHTFRHPHEWFDSELRQVFGVDVYSQPFPRKTGYARFETEIADVLLIRFEDFARCGAAALSEFLELPLPETIMLNRTEAKRKIGPLARAFRNGLRLPAEFIERQHATKYARHFYSAEELADCGSAYRKP